MSSKTFGPDIYTRNNHGLLNNVEYIFNEDGSVDWRSMIKEEYLYPNREWFEKRNKEIPEDFSGLEDFQLCIMLAGIKELAKLRGFDSVSYDIVKSEDNYVIAKCTIHWIANYENTKNALYQDVGSAHAGNTDSFGMDYLEAIACNRAFVRCVRNFLNIHIVGADEITKTKAKNTTHSSGSIQSNPTSPSGIFQKTLREKHFVNSFEDFKELLRDLYREQKYINSEVVNWKSFEHIPVKEIRKIAEVLSK